MNRTYIPLLYATAMLSLLAGCSDPAKNVPKAPASEPQKAETAPAGGAKDYVIRSGSKIGFIASKVTGKHNGGFTNFAGNFQVSDGKIVGAPEIQIAMKSIWTDTDRLTGHLKTGDFFDVAKFPLAKFTATSIQQARADQKVTAKITGNLYLHGVTKSIS